MIPPLPLLLIAVMGFLIYLTNKKAKIKINPNRYTLIRVLVLVITIPVISLIFYLLYGRSGLEGAFYFSYYFFGAWLLYLLAEAVALFITKQKELARTSLLVFFLSAFIGGVGTFAYFSGLH